MLPRASCCWFLHLLKYSNLRAIAPALGELLSDILASLEIAADVLVPVPLHHRRLKQRGYNQAHLLAKEVGNRLGVPVAAHALSRLRDTPPQAKSLSAQERRSNGAGSFRCAEQPAIAGQGVLLVDDVCTTGATLEACAITLKKAGALSVWGIALTREA